MLGNRDEMLTLQRGYTPNCGGPQGSHFPLLMTQELIDVDKTLYLIVLVEARSGLSDEQFHASALSTSCSWAGRFSSAFVGTGIKAVISSTIRRVALGMAKLIVAARRPA